MVLAAALGLVSSTLGQAQEESGRTQGQACIDDTPAQTYPLPFAVEVIEDQAGTETRERREEEARQREIANLAAQHRTTASTEEMNAATQDMRDYVLYSTVLVGVGTGLLVVTLLLTWQADRAAVAAVDITKDIGQRQVRAYVGVTEAGTQYI